MERKPTLIFDGDCSFCRVWIKGWKERTGNQVTYIPFQQSGILEKYQISESDAKKAIHLISPSGERLQSSFHLCSSYGLFAVMTTSRPEIVIEGSEDGIEWKEYEFHYKPGNPNSSPRFVAPHQPRLDWQMWFAAMQLPPNWVLNFMIRLLQGSPEVIKLLKHNPFPIHPPRLIRAAYYKYQIATLEEHRDQKLWWRREKLGLYFPPCQLTDQEEAA
ncbi:MAG: lipase maturation factor family protein [Bdellovibrionia bacterium]